MPKIQKCKNVNSLVITFSNFFTNYINVKHYIDNFKMWLFNIFTKMLNRQDTSPKCEETPRSAVYFLVMGNKNVGGCY